METFNELPIDQLVMYGGISVCTILAMTVFCDVLLKRLNEGKGK